MRSLTWSADYMRAEGAIRPSSVSFLADPLRRVHDDRDSEAMVLARVLDQTLSVFRANVGRIDNGQPPACEPLLEHVVQGVERIVRGMSGRSHRR